MVTIVRKVLQLPLLLQLIGTFATGAQDVIDVTELTPNVLVLATSSGNVVASIGPDGALLIGTPSAASTARIAEVLGQRTKSGMHYVVIFPENSTHSEGDAGWGKRGAFVAMQEKALERLGGHTMGSPHPIPHHLLELGVGRPPIAFSEVLTFDMNGEAIHIVHQSAGYSDADAIAHFHVANLVYMGEVFSGDGYPQVDIEQHGNLNGLMKTLNSWAGGSIGVVPARGKVTNGDALKVFCDMIANVRDRIQGMIAAGQTEDQILAAHPTAPFDAQWGHGRVSPDAFVREIYSALKKH